MFQTPGCVDWCVCTFMVVISSPCSHVCSHCMLMVEQTLRAHLASSLFLRTAPQKENTYATQARVHRLGAWDLLTLWQTLWHTVWHIFWHVHHSAAVFEKCYVTTGLCGPQHTICKRPCKACLALYRAIAGSDQLPARQYQTQTGSTCLCCTRTECPTPRMQRTASAKATWHASLTLSSGAMSMSAFLSPG